MVESCTEAALPGRLILLFLCFILCLCYFNGCYNLMGGYIQCKGDLEQRVYRRASQSPLDFAVMGPIQVRQSAQNLLGHTPGMAKRADYLADQNGIDHSISPPLAILTMGGVSYEVT